MGFRIMVDLYNAFLAHCPMCVAKYSHEWVNNKQMKELALDCITCLISSQIAGIGLDTGTITRIGVALKINNL